MPMLLMNLATAGMQIVLPRPPATTATLELFEAGTDNITTLDAISRRFGFTPRSFVTELTEHGL
jgi:hypothetical protein